MQRRQFIGAASVAAMLPALRLHAAEGTPQSMPLGERLWLVTGCGGNVTVFDTPEGVLLVDGGAPTHSARLLAEVRRLTGKDRVHTLFNTHWHHDQTGSNLALGDAGTRIIAHEYTRLWLTTDIESRLDKRVYQPLPKPAQPNETFYTAGSITFGGEQVDYGHLGQAHTDGDIYVRFRNANVLVGGDVVAIGRFPISDPDSNGWIGGLGEAAGTLAGLADSGTRVVPGSGMPCDLAHLKAEQAMLVAMRQRLSRLLAEGKSATEMIEARPAADFEAAWGDPALFIRMAYPGMAHRARELGVSIV